MSSKGVLFQIKQRKMGFNIMVCGETDETYQAHNFFIDRSYYNFVANYMMFEDDALIIKAGEYYGVDLHPLVNVVYLDGLESDEQESAIQDAGELLELVQAFSNHLINHPEMIDKIKFASKFGRAEWVDYVRSGQLIEDLANVAKELAYYQKIGKPKVFFGVA